MLGYLDTIPSDKLSLYPHVSRPPGKFNCAPASSNKRNEHRTKMKENSKLPEMTWERSALSRY